jgi:2-oxoglutarate dehydrogenase E1 component
LAPFPYDIIKEELAKYKNAKVAFSQEEHKNAGAYEFVKARLQTVLLSMSDSRVNELT